MITNVYSHSGFVTANSTVGGPYINAGTPSAGMLRYHNSQVQVYDGTSWLAMTGTSSVGLSPEAEKIMNWARQYSRAKPARSGWHARPRPKAECRH